MVRRITIIPQLHTWSWAAWFVYSVTGVVIVNALINVRDAIAYRLRLGRWVLGADTTDPLYELGTSLGFWGMLFFCLNFILATRWHWVETLSGGLDKVYQLHAFVGKSAMTMLLLLQPQPPDKG